ncbi:NAD(P)/FAD-dependent oxidoreductase [Mesobacillus maritimus]|uniref:NAD(P)/FAD-dependent oxidoreductase n=1 Tax=Mesobacillus maritimus TaxID=1643336 RepID=UPI0038505B93
MDTDVLIIGAGPAGLSAAYETASRGLEVMVVDETLTKGGQLIQQTQQIHSLPSLFPPMRGFELANRLKEALKNLPIQCLLGHRVVGLYKDGSIGITNEEDVFPVKAKKIIVATGASENAISFPKWTLPGVMTIGAAQTLINRDFVVPGKEAVIVGSSDFTMDVVLQLLAVGVKVKGIVEEGNTAVSKNTDLVNQVKETGVPLYFGSSIKEARGNGEVEEIDIETTKELLTVPVDLVCIDGGRAPILDVFYQLGCAFGYQEKLGGWIPLYNTKFQTNREEIFLAGNAGGISTQGVLILTGMIAGVSVCESFNLIKMEEAERIRGSLWEELEIFENKLDAAKWQGRKKHMENFKVPLIKDQFIS